MAGSSRIRRLLTTSLALAVVAVVVVTGPAAAQVGTLVEVPGADVVPGSYIVALEEEAVPAAAAAAIADAMSRSYGGQVAKVWTEALLGFNIRMTDAQARALAADGRVAFVQQDAVVHAVATQANPPSWGLDRVDQRNLPLDNSYTYATTAANVHAYVVDTGIRTTHTAFGGRATWGSNSIDANNTDCDGHGTHVAGTIGGSQYGVAKGVALVAVKVLDCDGSGTTSSVVDGLNWVIGHALKPAVANMSLGGGPDPALDMALTNTVNAGIPVAVAAGNESQNACNTSPARVAAGITVGATDSSDHRPSFSNYGTCLDLFAPGVAITSSYATSDTATNTISGTSMASPHVAGAAALYLAANTNATPAQVRDAMVAASTLNKVIGPGTGSPNRLLFTGTGTPAPLSVTPPGNKSGTVGTAVSLQLTASGGTPPYSWSATGLPAGLTIASSTGLVSGTPTTAGTYTVTPKVTDSAARTATTTFTWAITQSTGTCGGAGQKVANPGFESGVASWTASSGVIGQWGGSGQPAHGGTWSAWLNGYGTTHTDTVSQTVTIPAGCQAYTLSLWLHVDSAETTTSVQYDKLTVQLGATTLATYSNLNKAAGYVSKSFSVSGFAGQTVALKFTGTEDYSLQTSFVVDDVTLQVS